MLVEQIDKINNILRTNEIGVALSSVYRNGFYSLRLVDKAEDICLVSDLNMHQALSYLEVLETTIKFMYKSKDEQRGSRKIDVGDKVAIKRSNSVGVVTKINPYKRRAYQHPYHTCSVKLDNGRTYCFNPSNLRLISGDIIRKDELRTYKMKWEDIIKEAKNAETFAYQLLGRLRSDCKYYLGCGNHNPRCLWAKDEVEQIEYMKELYQAFPEDKKPDWISMEEIEKYEREFTFDASK